jgi:large subunit ribosomal protein L15
MPLQRRLPKRGFTNAFKLNYAVINVSDLTRFSPGSEVDPGVLKASGLVKDMKDGIKLLGQGEISSPMIVRIHKASQTALQKIERAGGKVNLIQR